MAEGHADLAIVGAGIVGLAHAYHAARRGWSVVVFERSLQAQGASIRNFGMLWPIGQAPGRAYRIASRSREIWSDVIEQAKLWHDSSGSLHVAYQTDEMAVLEEFNERAPVLGYECQLLTSADVLERSPAVRSEGLLGALYSTTEMIVDPREVIAKLPAWLAERYGVSFRFGRTVLSVNLPKVVTSTETWHADRVVVCGGADFETLYPEIFAQSGLVRCKLQMMRTVPQPGGWRLGPALCGGLTLRHYAAFQGCDSLAAYRARIAHEMPEYDRWGIHVMVAQNGLGELIIGDSHEYSNIVDIFDKPEIDRLILDYLNTFCIVPEMRIAQRWHGVYAKHPEEIVFIHSPGPDAQIVASPGGAGMTLSFGIAEEVIGRLN